jgi:hypothetical protein
VRKRSTVTFRHSTKIWPTDKAWPDVRRADLDRRCSHYITRAKSERAARNGHSMLACRDGNLGRCRAGAEIPLSGSAIHTSMWGIL